MDIKKVQQRIIAILTARAAGDHATAEALMAEVYPDTLLLTASFGSALRFAEDMVAIIADMRNVPMEQVIREVAVTVAGRRDEEDEPQ